MLFLFRAMDIHSYTSLPDTRDPLWADLEAKIQKRALAKDTKLSLSGDWKRFVRTQDGFKVFAVDGEWIRNNLSVIFGHGGHGYVHEFIPLDEIWVGIHHFDDCGCKNVSPDLLVSPQYFESTIVHEIIEFQEMEKGAIYWDAHNFALQKEMELGLLEDPFTDC